MSINASSGAPQVKVSCSPLPFLSPQARIDPRVAWGQAWMYHSEWEEKRAAPTEKTAKQKPLKSTTRAPLRTSQETADEIMRLNATHGHPSVKVRVLFTGEKVVTVADFLSPRLISPASNKPSLHHPKNSPRTIRFLPMNKARSPTISSVHSTTPSALSPIHLDRRVRHLASPDPSPCLIDSIDWPRLEGLDSPRRVSCTDGTALRARFADGCVQTLSPVILFLFSLQGSVPYSL